MTAQLNTDNPYFAVQGLSRGVWQTLFAPFWSVTDALTMRDQLRDANPACRYQVIHVATVVEVAA